jgi:hypothetical protein
MSSTVFTKALVLFDNDIYLTNAHWKQLYVPFQNTWYVHSHASQIHGTGLWPVSLRFIFTRVYRCLRVEHTGILSVSRT